MTSPTRQEIIDAYEALETLCARVPEETPAYAMKSLILTALPPRPQPTMADVEWDDEKHYLAEAEHANDYTVMMLKPMRLEPRIKCLAFHGRDFCIVYSDPKDLTPTGRLYTLTEVQE